MACASRGSFQYVPGGADLPTILSPYFEYLLKTSTPKMGEVFWSDPYIDAFGLGLMVTIASPVIVSSLVMVSSRCLVNVVAPGG